MQMHLLSLYILQTSQENTFAGGKKEAWKTTERSHSKFQIQLGIRDGLHNYTLITIRGLNNLWFKVGFIERGALWDLTLHLLFLHTEGQFNLRNKQLNCKCISIRLNRQAWEMTIIS